MEEIELIINKVNKSKFTKVIKLIIKQKIHFSWSAIFLLQYKRLYKIFKQIKKDKLDQKVYPKEENIFRIFRIDINNIKVVFLGQDPYIKYNQATGYAFCVPKNVPIPPSLANIYKELNIEYPERNYKFEDGDISSWVDKGIFLLNSALTVIEYKSNSHQYLWRVFINIIIKYIDYYKDNIVFLLLGNNAIEKSKYIKKNKIVKGVHPSPLSANNGFFNSNIFKNIDKLLEENIDWKL